jgi:putative adenylate-forming enzyme
MNANILVGVLWAIRQQRQHDRWTRERLEAYQTDELQRLRTFAYAQSPFYRRFHEGLTDRSLCELPVLTKAMLMEHFDELVTDRSLHLRDIEAHLARIQGTERLRGRYWASATSGSTGRRGLFVFDDAEWAHVLASFARAREWGGTGIDLRRRMRIASVASTTPWHMSALAAASFRSPWVSMLRLDAAEAMTSIVARLNQWQPEMLVAYASMAGLLAVEQQAGRLHISPRMVCPASEVLTPEMRHRVEIVWGKCIFEQYAATETAGIAAECEAHHGLHLFEDLVITEVVDAAYQPVPPGAYGEKVLVTVLFSRTQPLIRYELNDSIRLAATAPACRLPYRVVDGVQGRTEDILQFPGANGMVIVHPNVLHRVMDTVAAGAWQIVQEPDGLTVLLTGGDRSLDTTVADSLRQALLAQGASSPHVYVCHVEQIPRGITGKTRLIVASPKTSPTP